VTLNPGQYCTKNDEEKVGSVGHKEGGLGEGRRNASCMIGRTCNPGLRGFAIALERRTVMKAGR
jgi:hypothetical protein